MSEIVRQKKVHNKFMHIWLSNEIFKDWILKKDDYSAGFNLCKRFFTVRHSGVAAVNVHKNSATHIKQ